MTFVCVCVCVCAEEKKQKINQLDIRGEKNFQSLCYKNILHSGKLAQNLARFGFHIRQAASATEELSSKKVCIEKKLELFEREKN